MKQKITKEQWDEVSDDEANFFMGYRIKKNVRMRPYIYPTIGQMIEFLGDDIDDILKCNHWVVRMNFRKENNIPTYDKTQQPELVDALWEAVKYKIKHNKLN